MAKNYTKTTVYKGREKIANIRKGETCLSFGWTNREKPVRIKRFYDVNSKEFESLCRLLGAYIAEGSTNTPETANRYGASISGDKNGRETAGRRW